MDELETILTAARVEIESASTTAELAQIDTKYLGKNGSVQAQLKSIGSLPKEERPAFGARINAAKEQLTAKIEERRGQLASAETQIRRREEAIDITLPGRPIPAGRRHPLTSTMIRVKEVLAGLGYEFVEGPELEDYAYNFAAL